MPKNKFKNTHKAESTQVLTPFHDGLPPEKLDSYYLDCLLPYQEIKRGDCKLGVSLNLLKKLYEHQAPKKIAHSCNQSSLDISLITGVHDIFSGKLLTVRRSSIKKERIPSVVIPPEMKLFSGFYILNNYFPYYPKGVRACFSLELPAVHFKEIYEDYFKSLNQFLFHDFPDQLQYRYKLSLLCGMMFWVNQQDKREFSILNKAIDNLLRLESIVNLSVFDHPILPDALPEYNAPSIFPSPFHCLVRVDKCRFNVTPDFFKKIHDGLVRNYTSLKCDVVVRFFLDEMINFLITLLEFIDTVSDQKIKIDFYKKINSIYSKNQGIFDWLRKEKDIIFNPQKISSQRIHEENFFLMENVEGFELDELKFIYNNLEEIFLPRLQRSKDKIKKICDAIDESTQELTKAEEIEVIKKKITQGTKHHQQIYREKNSKKKDLLNNQCQLLQGTKAVSEIKPRKKSSDIDLAQYTVNQRIGGIDSPIKKESIIISSLRKSIKKESIESVSIEELSLLKKELGQKFFGESSNILTTSTVIEVVVLFDIYLTQLRHYERKYKREYYTLINSIKNNFGKKFTKQDHENNRKINERLSDITNLIGYLDEYSHKLLVCCQLLNDWVENKNFDKLWIPVIDFRVGEFTDLQSSMNDISVQFKEYRNNKAQAFHQGKISSSKSKNHDEKNKEKQALSRCDNILKNFDNVLSLVENMTMITGFTEDVLRRQIADQGIKKITEVGLARKIVPYNLSNELTNNLRLSQSYTSLVSDNILSGLFSVKQYNNSCPNLFFSDNTV